MTTIQIQKDIEADLQRADALERQLAQIKESLKKRSKDTVLVLVKNREEIIGRIKALDDEVHRLRQKKSRLSNDQVQLFYKLRKLGWSPLRNPEGS